MGPFYGVLLALVAAVFVVPLNAQDDQQPPAAEDNQCSCSGVDYTNGGSYLIDGTTNDNFTFTSVFAGCQDSFVIPVLVDPNGNDIACSTIESQPENTEQVSTCNIMYSEMASGTWNVVIQATDFDFTVQRTFRITSGGSANTVLVTATPTVYVGVTTSVEASTVVSDVVETDVIVGDPYTVTEDCAVPTQTYVQYLQGPTTTIWTEIQRWQTNGAVTNYYQTTVWQQAYCHWPQPTQDRPPPSKPTVSRCESDRDRNWKTCSRPWYSGGTWTLTPVPTTTRTYHHTSTPTTYTRPGSTYSSCRGGQCVTTIVTTLPRPTRTTTTSRPTVTTRPTTLPTSRPHDTSPPTVTTRPTTLPTSRPHDTSPPTVTTRPTTLPTSRPHDTSPPTVTTRPTTLPTSRPHETSPPTVTTRPTTLPTSRPHETSPPIVTTRPTTLPTSRPRDTETPPVTTRITTITRPSTSRDPPPVTTRTTSLPHTNPPTTLTTIPRPTTAPDRPTSRESTTRPREPTSSPQRPTTSQPQPTREPTRPSSSTREPQRPTTSQPQPTREPSRPSSSTREPQRPSTSQPQPTREPSRPSSSTREPQRPSTSQPQPTREPPRSSSSPTRITQRPTSPQPTREPPRTSSSPPRSTEPSRGGGGGSGGSGGGGHKPVPGETIADEIEIPQITAIARRGVAKVADITSTITETTYTVTSTIVETAPAETVTETDYYAVTSTYYPPDQTVCGDSDATVTIYYQGPPHTEYQVNYVTYNTWITVWVGQTQYSTATDYGVMTRCHEGGGWYGA